MATKKVAFFVREATEIRVTDLEKPVKILENVIDNEAASIDPISVPEVFSQTVARFPNLEALLYKNEETKEWNAITFKEYKDRVEHMAKVFIKLGLKRHGTVAVLAFNCVEWFVAELAAIHAGGIITGIYTTNSADACLHILENSRANIVVVDDESQLNKIRQIKDKLQFLKAVVQIHPNKSDLNNADGYWRWADLEKVQIDDEIEEKYLNRLNDIAVNECCCLIFTSGTVGNPKGVMLSHDNIMFTAKVGLASFGKAEVGNETIVSYLPLSHAAAQVLDVFGAILIGGTVYFADKNAMKGTLFETVREAKPTIFFTVPRLFEKIQEKMMAIGAENGFIKRKIGAWAKTAALEHHMNRLRGNPTNTLQYRIASKFILSKVKEALGFQRCRTFFTGAAPLNVDTKKYFLSLDMFIYEGYGMSESTVHTLTSMDTPSFETVGKCLPGIETKVINANDEGRGEICMRGRHVFMGYVNEPEKTLEAIDDERWLHSGDVGYIDKDGYIFITGRIKELIITSGGENIPYINIENQVKSECSAISNAFLIGDRRKFLTMLVTLKTESKEDGSPQDKLAPETVSWLQQIGLAYTKLSEVLNDEKVKQAVQEAINRVNTKSISNAQKVQKFAILPNDFTIATGELTPTMKLKRNVVLNKYKNLIDSFYE